MRTAQSQKDALAAYRVVFSALGMSPEMVRMAFGAQAAMR
jgi:hypothetical protein